MHGSTDVMIKGLKILPDKAGDSRTLFYRYSQSGRLVRLNRRTRVNLSGVCNHRQAQPLLK